MKICKMLFLFVSLGFFSNAFSQHLICGKVINQKGEALYPANIKLKNSKLGAITDNDGNFCLNSPLKAELIVSFMGYETANKKIVFLSQQKDTLILIVLNEKKIDLKEVEISASNIELITKENRIWISDYEFWNDNIITLNIDENNRKLSLINHNDSLIWETELNGSIARSKRIYKDFMSNIYLLSDDSAFQVTNKDESIYFFHGVAIADINKLILPSMGKCGDEIIYRVYGPHNKSVYYYLIDRDEKELLYSQRDAESELFCQDVFKDITENTNSAKYAGDVYDYPVLMSSEPSNDSHNDWKLNIKKRTTTSRHNKEIYDKIMTQAIETHLFKIEDKIYIFDHFASKILVYDCDGKLLHDINTFYPKRKDIVSKQLILADNKKDVYALFLNDGLYSIQQIDLISGKLKGSEIKINLSFVEIINVYNNHIYFIYKQNKEDARKRLYRMRK